MTATQAACRRKIGRTYRSLLRKAIVGLDAALRAVRAATAITDREVRAGGTP